MALNFGQLVTILTPGQDGKLQVAGSAFETPGVESLFAGYLPGGALSLTGATARPAPDANTVTVATGALATDLLGQPGASVANATFKLRDDGTVAADIPIHLPGAAWPLSSAFPALTGGIFDSLLCTGAVLTLDSTVANPLPADFRERFGYEPDDPLITAHSVQGATLAASISFADDLAADVAVMFSTPIDVSGPVSLYAAPPAASGPSPAPVPQLLLQPAGSPGTPVTVGTYTFTFALQIASLLQEFPDPDGTAVGVLPVAFMEVSTQFDTGATAPFPISAQVYGGSAGRLVLDAGSPPSATVAPDALGKMLGGASPQSLLSPGFDFPAVTALEFTGASAAIDVRTKSLEEIVLGFKLAPSPGASPWSVFDILDVTEIGFRLGATRDGTSLAPNAAIFAQAQLHGQASPTLAAYATLPDLSFSCTLEEEGTLDLTKVATDLLGTSVPLPTLTGGSLGIAGSVSTHTYSLDASITDSWTIAGSAASGLTLDGFRLVLEKSSAGVAGTVYAELTFAGRDLMLSAGYASEVWTFTATTMPGPPVTLGTIVSDVAGIFELEVPADVLPSVAIDDISLTLTHPGDDFTFDCDGTISLLGETIGIAIELGATTDAEGARTTVFNGTLTVGGQPFVTDLTSSPGQLGILFKWTGTALTFEQIAKELGVKLPPIPGGLELDLTEASLYYSEQAGKQTIAVSATSTHGQVAFVSAPGAEVLTLEVPLGLDFGKLPVAGGMLPGGSAPEVKDVQLVLAFGALDGPAVKTANDALGVLGADPLPATTLADGATFAMTLTGATPETFVLPLSSPPPQPEPSPPAPPAPERGLVAAAPAPPAAPSRYDAGAKWLAIDKTLGPVSVARVGVQYQDDVLFFLIDASLELSALTIGLDSLGIGSSLSALDLKPHLGGLSVSFSAGPVDVSGGLLEVAPAALPAGAEYEYDGELTVTAEAWTLVGVAGYAKLAHGPAFFLFAEVDGEFGGPPSFFITGLMGGLGYNYSLALPKPDQVASFPFVASAGTGGGLGPPDQVLTELTGTGSGGPWLTPEVGSFWGAVGLTFRSFELVLGRAVLVIEVNHDVQIALLGTATMALPQGSTDGYAYVELQMEAVLEPDQGYFGVTASLTPSSYLLTPDCHLTGGFAFCTWFGDNAHAGDFVLTAGGYHPAFSVPSWYPQVSRVGFDWHVGGGVNVSGSAYFALTPSALMAGGNLCAAYESGELKAWFSAWANALITWKPFHFKADIGISVGASYRLDLLFTTVTISIELGAQLEIWGPPTGGVAHVDWSIISFTVPFGDDGTDPPKQTLEWAQVEDLLPGGSGSGDSTPALATQANTGLTGQDERGWIVRADEFSFTVASPVPVSAVTWGADEAKLVESAAPAGIQVRPMNLSNAVASSLNVKVTLEDDGTPQPLSAWAPSANDAGLPGSLWGAPLNGADPPAGNETVASTTGVSLTAPAATEGPSPGTVDMTALTEALLPSGPRVLDPNGQPSAVPPAAADPGSIGEIASAFAAPAPGVVPPTPNLAATEAAQQLILGALAGFEASPPTTGLTVKLATEAVTAFADPPMTVAG